YASEYDARILNRCAIEMQTHCQRRHREVPDTSGPQLLERSFESGLRRGQDHFREDFIEADDVRLDSSIHHHVTGHELLQRQFFHSRWRRQLYFCVEWNHRCRDVAWINGIAQASPHGGVIIAVITNRPVADISAVSPA